MVVSNHDIHLNDICLVNTREADECLLLHKLDVSKSFDRIFIKTVDSDIVIITTAVFRKIPSIKELWIEFSKGNPLSLF